MNTEELKPENEQMPEEQNQIAVTEDQDQHEDELHPAEDISGLSREELFKRLEEINALTELESSRGMVQKIKDLFREITREDLEKKRREWEATKEDEHDVFMPATDKLAEKFEDT